MRLALHSVRIKGDRCSTGTCAYTYTTPEELIRHLLSHDSLYDVKPTDTLQVEAVVFAKKSTRSSKESALGTVVIAEYPASQFLNRRE